MTTTDVISEQALTFGYLVTVLSGLMWDRTTPFQFTSIRLDRYFPVVIPAQVNAYFLATV